jgi:hypothetical protein
MRWTSILSGRRRPGTVTFCDSCSQVCDTRCRARAGRDRHRDRALYTVGMR